MSSSRGRRLLGVVLVASATLGAVAGVGPATPRSAGAQNALPEAPPVAEPGSPVVAEQPPSNDAGPRTRSRLDELPSFGEQIVRTLVVLVAMVGALWIAARLMPRWLGRRGILRAGRRIEVLESTTVGPRRTIALVRVAGEYFLIGATDQRVELLAGGRLDAARLDELFPPTESSSARRASTAHQESPGSPHATTGTTRADPGTFAQRLASPDRET